MDKDKLWAKAVQRFWKFVCIRSIDECWEWQGGHNGQGYGSFNIGVRKVMAHRFSWVIHNGAIPNDDSYHGICVLHKCDNPKCVNPNHLFLGTQGDNLKDMAKKNRGNGRAAAKLTREQALEIKAILAAPYRLRPTLRQIAREYGVSHNTIWLIERGIAWRNP